MLQYRVLSVIGLVKTGFLKTLRGLAFTTMKI